MSLPAPHLTMIEPALREKHRQRALAQIRLQLCTRMWTDGFCMGNREGCRCATMAEAILGGFDLVGCVVVWEYDPAVGKALGR